MAGNRAERRREERAKARGVDTVAPRTKLRATDFDDGFEPSPGPLSTGVDVYKYGGDNWVLITVSQPMGSSVLMMKPEDAEEFGAGVMEIAQKAGGKMIERVSGLVIPSATGGKATTP